MTSDPFDLALEELTSAEDFLDYFGIDYDPQVVRVKRLHILQRFHDYLADVGEMPLDPAARHALHADLLAGAYHDFVVSDARTEKVFRVFRARAPRAVAVPLMELTDQLPHAS